MLKEPLHKGGLF